MLPLDETHEMSSRAKSQIYGKTTFIKDSFRLEKGSGNFSDKTSGIILRNTYYWWLAQVPKLLTVLGCYASPWVAAFNDFLIPEGPFIIKML